MEYHGMPQHAAVLNSARFWKEVPSFRKDASWSTPTDHARRNDPTSIPTIWVNYNDLIVFPHWEWWLVGVTIPFMTASFRLVNYVNLPSTIFGSLLSLLHLGQSVSIRKNLQILILTGRSSPLAPADPIWPMIQVSESVNLRETHRAMNLHRNN